MDEDAIIIEAAQLESASPRSGVARNASFLALGQFCTTALAIVLSAALGRGLGAHDFGLYFLVTSMATFALGFAEWGLASVVVRETARHPEEAGELLGTVSVLRLVGVVAVTGPALLLAIVFGYDTRTRLLLAVYLAGMVPAFLAQGVGTVFRGQDRMDKDAVVSVVNKLVGLGLVVLVLARGGGLVGVGLVQGLAGLAALVAAHRLYRRGRNPPLAATRVMARRLFLAGAPVIAMGAASSVQPYLDAVILSKLVPSDAMGWYGVAKNILGTLIAPALILGAAAFPQLSRAAADEERLRTETQAALRPVLFLGALGSAGTFLFADVAVHIIYGKGGYGPAAQILRASAPGLFLLFTDVVLGTVMLAVHRVGQFAVVKVASVVVSTALDLLLIPWFQQHHGNGGVGVVVSFALSEILVFAGALLILPRRTLSAASALDAAKAMACALVTVAVIGAAPGLPPVVAIPGCIAIFVAMGFAVGLVRRSDVAPIRALLRR